MKFGIKGHRHVLDKSPKQKQITVQDNTYVAQTGINIIIKFENGRTNLTHIISKSQYVL